MNCLFSGRLADCAALAGTLTPSMQNVELQRMAACSFETAVQVWNEGFTGYFVDMTLTLDKFLIRISLEGVGPEHSLIAFVGGKPVGFLFSGIRSEGGRKLAWNGGTGVVPAFRGKGIGKILLQAALDLYRSEGVQLALLEAINENKPAIALYKKFGYEVVDELTFLQTDDPPRSFKANRSCTASFVSPADVRTLSFYQTLSPWQGQWQSLVRKNGDAIIVKAASGAPLGYALFLRRFDNDGKLSSISLHQCEVAPQVADPEGVAGFMLQQVFVPDLRVSHRTTHNLRRSNELVLELLLKAGFSSSIEQVHMINKL